MTCLDCLNLSSVLPKLVCGTLGLGLAMTKRIVEWHGGSIAARNQAAGGLVIQILFPDRRSSDTDLHESLDLPPVTTMG